MKHVKKSVLMMMAMLTCLFTIALGSSALAANKTVNLGTLSSKKIHVDTTSENGYLYYQFKLTKPGYVVVSGGSIGSAGGEYALPFVLCNSKNQIIDYSTFHYEKAADGEYITYGLTKGTYKVRVDARADYTYQIILLMTAKKDQGGAKKGKALKMTRNKYYSDIIGAGSKASASGWFKFTTNGKKKVKLALATLGQGSFKFTISGNGQTTSNYLSANKKGTLTLFTQVYKGGKSYKKPLKAGTYYVRIQKSSTKSNGWIRLKWK